MQHIFWQALCDKAWKQDGDRQLFIGAPKSARSRWTISFSPDLAEMLRDITADKRGTDLVFVNVAGRPIRNNTFWATNWSPAITKAQNPLDTDGSPDLGARYSHLMPAQQLNAAEVAAAMGRLRRRPASRGEAAPPSAS